MILADLLNVFLARNGNSLHLRAGACPVISHGSETSEMTEIGILTEHDLANFLVEFVPTNLRAELGSQKDEPDSSGEVVMAFPYGAITRFVVRLARRGERIAFDFFPVPRPLLDQGWA